MRRSTKAGTAPERTSERNSIRDVPSGRGTTRQVASIAARSEGSLSYHFRNIGIEGLSVVGSYTQGWDRNGNDGASLPHRREVNLTLDYRVQGGYLRGLWIRARAAIHNEDGAEETGHDLRIILRYEIPIF